MSKNKQSALFLVKGNKNSAGEHLYTHKSIEFNCIFTQKQYQLPLVSDYKRKGSLKLRNT